MISRTPRSWFFIEKLNNVTYDKRRIMQKSKYMIQYHIMHTRNERRHDYYSKQDNQVNNESDLPENENTS
jgi:hypothetical protein